MNDETSKTNPTEAMIEAGARAHWAALDNAPPNNSPWEKVPRANQELFRQQARQIYVAMESARCPMT